MAYKLVVLKFGEDDFDKTTQGRSPEIVRVLARARNAISRYFDLTKTRQFAGVRRRDNFNLERIRPTTSVV